MESALKNECIPFYEPGKALTGYCSAAVTGKRFVMIGATKHDASFGLATDGLGGNIVIKTSTANNAKIVGVSGRDGKEKENILFYGPGFIVPITAGEAISAGEEVAVGAEGKAVKAEAPSKAEVEEGKITNKPAVGLCYTDTESGKDAMVRVYA